MEVDGGKPLVGAAAAPEAADVRGFARVQTRVDEHVGALGERLPALRAGVHDAVLADPRGLTVVAAVHVCREVGGEW